MEASLPKTSWIWKMPGFKQLRAFKKHPVVIEAEATTAFDETLPQLARADLVAPPAALLDAKNSFDQLCDASEKLQRASARLDSLRIRLVRWPPMIETLLMSK